MRNPYLILGIPFGVSVDVARQAFNKAMRRISREVNPPFSVDDLNWAIYAIEQYAKQGQEPELDIQNYRVPLSSNSFAGLDFIKMAKLTDMVLPQPNSQPIARVTGNNAKPELKELVTSELFSTVAAKYQSAPLPPLVVFQGD